MQEQRKEKGKRGKERKTNASVGVVLSTGTAPSWIFFFFLQEKKLHLIQPTPKKNSMQYPVRTRVPDCAQDVGDSARDAADSPRPRCVRPLSRRRRRGVSERPVSLPLAALRVWKIAALPQPLSTSAGSLSASTDCHANRSHHISTPPSTATSRSTYSGSPADSIR